MQFRSSLFLALTLFLVSCAKEDTFYKGSSAISGPIPSSIPTPSAEEENKSEDNSIELEEPKLSEPPISIIEIDKKAEEDAKKVAEEEAKKKAEEEAKKVAEEEAKKKAEEEAKKKAEEEAKKVAEEEAKKKAEEEAKKVAEEEAKKKAEEEAKKVAEEEAKKKAEEEAKKKAEEEAKKVAEEEAKKKAEEEAKKKAEEEAKKVAEEEAKKKAEEDAKKVAEEEEAKKKADEVKKENELCDKGEEACELDPVVTKVGVVTILLALGDIAQDKRVISEDSAQLIAQNAVKFSSPVKFPKILVVKDSNHQGESAEDTQFIAEKLLASYKTTVFNEGPEGLKESDLVGYDLVWFNNPGYPMGSINSLKALKAFKGGVILSGDDLAFGQGFSTESLTGLKGINNGTTVSCNNKTYNYDNNGGYSYRVSLEEKFLPGIAPNLLKFEYGNDIDDSRLAQSSSKYEVLAYANGAKGTCEFKRPVIVRYEK